LLSTYYSSAGNAGINQSAMAQIFPLKYSVRLCTAMEYEGKNLNNLPMSFSKPGRKSLQEEKFRFNRAAW
jgi:hypothetical protein